MFDFYYRSKYSNSLLILRLEFGLVTVIKGKVTQDLLSSLEDITKRTRDKGIMHLSYQNDKLNLEFSDTISNSTKQRIINTFPYDKYKLLRPKHETFQR